MSPPLSTLLREGRWGPCRAWVFLPNSSGLWRGREMDCCGDIPFCQKWSDMSACMLSSCNQGNRQKLVSRIQPDCFQFLERQRAPFILCLELTVLQLAWIKVMLNAWNMFTVILDSKVHLASGKFATLDFWISFLLFVCYKPPDLALLGNVSALLKTQPVYDIIVAYIWIECW